MIDVDEDEMKQSKKADPMMACLQRLSLLFSPVTLPGKLQNVGEYSVV
jgi:hypothetical protein